MPVYLVARGRIHDQEMHDDYVAKAVPTFPADARVLAVDLETEMVEGAATDRRTVVIEFPSREAFRAWYDSPEYQAVLPLRLGSVEGTLVVAEGFVPDS
jgi:uncharacterized protein (DUF1330 family)